MNVTLSMIKQLRQTTGAAVMECKKALVAAEGDGDAALEILRKSGHAKAARQSARLATEGLIVMQIAADNKTATLLEVNCETDFVARDEQFNEFCQMAATASLDATVRTIEDLRVFSSNGTTIDEVRLALAARVGENVQIRRFAKLSRQGDALAGYNHGHRIGVVVDIVDGTEVLAKDIAMHVAASRPLWLSEQEVPAQWLDKEREILNAQVERSAKPQHLIERIVAGKLKKRLNEITLLGQAFIKDLDQTVAQLLKAHGASVRAFIRYEIGEGIERQKEDFAAEVMEQIKHN